MRLVRDWPFKDQLLELSKQEVATLKKAAAIAERAATLCEPESDAWYAWKSLEARANDHAN